MRLDTIPYSRVILKEIDPKELRLGNLVYRREGSSDNEGHFIATHIPMELSEWWTTRFPNCCYPIELTEEVLYKLGFEECFSLETFHLPGLHLQKEHSGWYIRLGNAYVNKMPIVAVHQLQNLYFALTGKEISVIG
ncbi:MAG: hypothetical protein JNN00_07455 [Chitinophagaceae bacterium]|nr:hypothetical protein [Chitinophagaceae bacterium]